jgi:ubiquinone/menaquinone biosynthesis C-methylase UbiE
MADAWASYLAQVAASPEGAAIKERSRELLALQPGESVLDVGCGPGVDTIPFAYSVGPTGHVSGVDADPAMVALANSSALQHGVATWTMHTVAVATALPFNERSFDAWHAERVLQHLPWAQPLAALREARRVLRPGGRMVVVDTDWATLSVPSDTPDVERRLTRLHMSRLANGYIGRTLPRLVRQAGLIRSAVERFVVELSASSLDFVLLPTEQAALGAHLISPLEWHVWRRSLEDYRSTGDTGATVAITLVAGRRP